MSAADLCAEMCAAHKITVEQRKRFLAAGIPQRAINLGWVGVLPCLVERERFQPYDDGKPLAIVPVKVDADQLTAEHPEPEDVLSHGEIVDLVAFRLSDPGKWWSRTGAASWLGCIRPQLFMPDPVNVWRSPLSWLQNSSTGIVPLARDHHSRWSVLAGLGSIIAESIQHGDELRRVLERPFPIPKIYVRATAAKAAA
jgi:hypothetical protein